MDSKKSVNAVGLGAGVGTEAPGARTGGVEGEAVLFDALTAARFGAPPSAIRLFSLYSSRLAWKLGSFRYSSNDPASDTGACFIDMISQRSNATRFVKRTNMFKIWNGYI